MCLGKKRNVFMCLILKTPPVSSRQVSPLPSSFNVWDTKLIGQSTLLGLFLLTNDQLKSVLLPKTPSCKYEQNTKHTLQNHDWSTWDSVCSM